MCRTNTFRNYSNKIVTSYTIRLILQGGGTDERHSQNIFSHYFGVGLEKIVLQKLYKRYKHKMFSNNRIELKVQKPLIQL